MAVLVALQPIAATIGQGTRAITWEDAGPVRDRLEAAGITRDRFDAHVARLRQSHARRVRDGDFDHLIFYLLQSTRFTSLPAIEPALSARALVDRLGADERKAFFRDPQSAASRVAEPVRARIAAFLRALDTPKVDARLPYFLALLDATVPSRSGREPALVAEYLRGMRFLYEKEFIAQRSARPQQAVAELYRTRGLSTDTAVEAGFLVSEALAVLRSLEPGRRVRRVLIVGPGLDLAPRTALVETSAPESYQPWAVLDALLAHGLSRVEDLEVVAADVNPRVVQHLERSRLAAPTLTLTSGIREGTELRFSEEYREYFARLGQAIGSAHASPPARDRSGHLHKRLAVRGDVARTLRPVALDVVTDRLSSAPFDVVIATNVLPYFDDVELAMAMANVAAMLAPDGAFLHNEARPVMHELSTALDLPLQQSRQAVIATVRGAAPLADSIWLHRRLRPPS